MSGGTSAEVDPPEEAGEHVPRRWGLGDVVVGFAVALVASTVLASVWLALAGATELGLAGLAVAQVGLWGGFLGAPWYASRRKGSRSFGRDFGFAFRPRDALVGIPIGLACQFGLVPLIYVPLARFIDTDELDRPVRELVDRAPGWTFFLLAAAVVIGAPVIEELFYRGLMLRAFQYRIGRAPAVAASSVWFGATHFQPLQFPALAAFGAVLALVTLRANRLGPAIWAHVSFNGATMIVLAFER